MSAVTRVISVGAAGLLTALLTAAPAFASDPIGPAEGADPGKSLSPAAALLIYVGIPVSAFLIIATLAYLPGAMSSHRYRPAKGWSAAPVWFAGPPEAAAAVDGAQLGDVTRGGASGSW